MLSTIIDVHHVSWWGWILDAPLFFLLWELVLQLTAWYILTPVDVVSLISLTPSWLLIYRREACFASRLPTISTMSSQTILYHHELIPVKTKNININLRHKYVVFFQEVPGGWTTCWPLYWVLLLRPAWLWYGGYGMVCYGMGGLGKLSYLGDTSPFGGFKHLNTAFHGLLTIWFVRDGNGNINTQWTGRGESETPHNVKRTKSAGRRNKFWIAGVVEGYWEPSVLATTSAM